MTMPVVGLPNAARGPASSPAKAIRTAVRRVLAVAALMLAVLLVFVLLPGRNVPAVMAGPYLLPAVPSAHSWHPHGPDRPVKPADPGRPSRARDPAGAVRGGGRCVRAGHAGAARCSAIELPPSTTRYWPVT